MIFYQEVSSVQKDLLATTIKESASIGANSTIVGGVTIEKYAMERQEAVIDIKKQNRFWCA
jgi:carbonic anhydrase/acetyltransferase-like protein (isoleucine patch superfamily)